MRQEDNEKDKDRSNFFFRNKVKIILAFIILLIGSYILYDYYDHAFSDKNQEYYNNISENSEEIVEKINESEESKVVDNLDNSDLESDESDQKEIITKDPVKSKRFPEKDFQERIKNEIDENMENESYQIIEKDGENLDQINMDEDGQDEVTTEKEEETTESEEYEQKENEEKRNNENSFKSMYREKFHQPWHEFSDSIEEKLDEFLNREDINDKDLSRTDILIAGVDNSRVDNNDNMETDSIIIFSFYPEANKISVYAVNTNKIVKNKPLKTITSPGKLKDHISYIYDHKPEYFLFIGYDGFVKIIDELEGIEISIEQSLHIPELDLELEKGKNTLTGEEALNYSRWLDPDKGEKDRIRRQLKLIKAAKNQLLTVDVLLDIPKLYNTMSEAYNSVETDVDFRLFYNSLKYLINREEDIKIEYLVID
ncbi:MAG: LCP family protein [Halanaerobiaceae bacterium]